ncbi:hypothetical protein HETIRDRAFT_125828 [Heterobasidion irregulare TC 32-1]|uniref:Short-chain dehydrogenase/reductase n=1 Tax=Heterobasidion irregulare (strain TC 32-1) TaxID=747525 RepID=W4JTL7_HETIT|nr:uncharacterized protein HETIRDRAFT_125828 [Heterobasidion irregulare TC 32-1]ETW76779.1 hypothetical protein HETIRDRAFT_125828 [Heterobasidion irregulare TC 32-1]
MSSRPIFVVAGVGNGTGASAFPLRVFSKAGYRIALIARGSDKLNKLAAELSQDGGEAATFPIGAYTYKEVQTAFAAVRAHWPDAEVRVALYNAGYGVRKPFLELTEAEVAESVETQVTAAFGFARSALLAFQAQALDARGKRGTLLLTGATASWRGNTTTAAFAAGKFGLRALSQSLSKEFGKQNIHAIIDGGILTDRSRGRGPEWESNPDIRLDPESIAKSYLYLAEQDRSAWTWELDLRPAHETW